MKNNLVEISQRYLVVLQSYLKAGPQADLQPARDIGRHAMTFGLETLDLARMHEIALVALVLPSYIAGHNDALMGRAGLFFAEALTPIEETHRGAREANVHLNQIIKTLSERTLELAQSVAELQQEIIQRQAIEASLRTSEQTASELLEHSRQMQEELRRLSRNLLSVQEEERRRISRELHDVIAQTLTGITMQLASLNTISAASVKDLQAKISNTQRLVEKSVDIVHRFARELRPAVLDDLGLIPALESFLKEFMTETGIRVKLTAFADIELSHSDTRTALYRIAQESFTNISRHAQASLVEVTLEGSPEHIRMEIKDNGKGFAMAGKTPTEPRSNRLGLLGMKERAEMVGGSLCIVSAPGQGTTVRVEIPASKGVAEDTTCLTPCESL